jgi:hypothetical protein
MSSTDQICDEDILVVEYFPRSILRKAEKKYLNLDKIYY